MRRLLPLIFVGLAPIIFAADGGGPTQYLMNYSGALDVNQAGTPTMWIDFTQDPSGATITSSDGGFVFTKSGAPSRILDYTYPNNNSGAHGYAHDFDGSNDSYYRNDDGTFDPSGSFSVQCVITTRSVAASSQTILSKYGASGDYGWKIGTYSTSLTFAMSEDGTVTDTNNATGVLVDQPIFFTHTYEYVASGSSVSTWYVGNLATDVDNTMLGPVNDSTVPFRIGIYQTVANFDGHIHYCAYYDGVVLSEAQHDAAFAQWRGTEDITGNVRLTVSSSSPPAVLVDDGSNLQPFFVASASNSIFAGVYGALFSRQVDNYCQRASFKSWAGAGDVTGWTETLGGSGTILEENTNVAHGFESVKLTTTGPGDDVELVGACLDIDETEDYVFSIWHKKASGTGDLYATVKGYSDAACTNDEVAEKSLTPGDVASTWDRAKGKIDSTDWAGTTAYATVTIGQADTAGVVYVDAVSLNKQQHHSDNFCGCDTDLTCSCDDMVPQAVTPSSITVGNWTVGGKAQFPEPLSIGGETRYTFMVAGTSGNNNRIMAWYASGNFNCRVYDSAGTACTSSIGGTVAADTSFDWKCTHTDDGIVTACLDGSCDPTPATGANMDGVSSTMFFGAPSASDGRNSWGSDFYFEDRIVP